MVVFRVNGAGPPVRPLSRGARSEGPRQEASRRGVRRVPARTGRVGSVLAQGDGNAQLPVPAPRDTRRRGASRRERQRTRPAAGPGTRRCFAALAVRRGFHDGSQLAPPPRGRTMLRRAGQHAAPVSASARRRPRGCGPLDESAGAKLMPPPMADWLRGSAPAGRAVSEAMRDFAPGWRKSPAPGRRRGRTSRARGSGGGDRAEGGAATA